MMENLDFCPGRTSPVGIVNTRMTQERLRFLVLAMAGEAGEAANIVKKQWRDGDYRPDWELILKKEIADVQAYILMLGEHMGFNPMEQAHEALAAFREKRARFGRSPVPEPKHIGRK
jgi:hypothetical protein